MHLNILTFNWHEPYLCLLSRLGHDFVVVEPEITPGKVRQWNEKMRPVPDNVSLVSLQEAIKELNHESFDLVIAQNIKDLMAVRDYHLPKILVFHNRLTTEIGLVNNSIKKENYLNNIQPLLHSISRVFISESKRDDWGLKGKVILPGLDVSEYGGYLGKNPAILRVGNLLKERDLMMGYSVAEMIKGRLPSITLGMNPTLPESALSKGFEDLKNHYRECRLFLNTTVDGYEDGYNLAMLEAMATGMPVVSTFNQTSPLVDGINGFVSHDIPYLKLCVSRLLDDPVLAREIGEAGRRTVLEQFNLQTFLKNWSELIQETIVNFLKDSGISLETQNSPFHLKKKKNILMDYVTNPVTTAFYLERALRKHHNVITCGAMITPDIKRQWNMEDLKWETTPQDIFRGSDDSIAKVMSQLPEQWEPDLYLWVETGIDKIPVDLKQLSIPKVCYLIDTHIHLERHLEIARQFDFVFLAQKEFVPQFESCGCKHVSWLPLACDPEIHGKQETAKKYDVGFVGSVTPGHHRRKNLLMRINEQFDIHITRKFMDEMTLTLCQSRIVFNNAINNDLNMRVFEALCSGSLLLTDSAPGSGLRDLFENKNHLVLYEDESLIDTVRYYLDHPEERERIAENGRREVLQKHTYEHRIQSMMDRLDGFFRTADSNEPRFQDAKPENYYQNVREDILPLIPQDASHILDVGCGAGRMGAVLKARPEKPLVAGIEMDPEAARLARLSLDDVVEGNIEAGDLPYEDDSFDCIICADVLEHLVDPLPVLNKLKRCLKPEGTLVASIPNVQYHGLIHHLTEGNWTYQKEGILDETHLRFFTFGEIEKLFASAGFEIVEMSETLDPQFNKIEMNGDKTSLTFGRVTLTDLSREELKRFFVFQYKIVTKQKITRENRNNIPRKREDTQNFKLNNARSLEEQGNYSEAVPLYREVLKEFPDCAEAWTGMGNAHFKMQDATSSLDCYQRALEIDTSFAEGWMGLALVSLQNGNFDKAIQEFNVVLDQQPENDKAQCGMGLALKQNGQREKSIQYFVRSLELNVENQVALTSLLQTAYELERFEEIETALRNYLQLHPDHPDMLFGLAGIQFKTGRVEEARETLDLILHFKPDHQDAIQMLDHISTKPLTK